MNRDPIIDRPSPIRLYRNPERGVILGVCAGIADYFGMKIWHVRVLAVLFLLAFHALPVVIYLIAAAVMKRRPAQDLRAPDEEHFWRAVAGKPDQTLHSLRHKYREIEERLAELERHVTSAEYTLNREFRDLER